MNQRNKAGRVAGEEENPEKKVVEQDETVAHR